MAPSKSIGGLPIVEELNQIAMRGVLHRLKVKIGRDPSPEEIALTLRRWRLSRPGAPHGDGVDEPVFEWRGLRVTRID